MPDGAIATDPLLKAKETGEEAQYIRQKDAELLSNLKQQLSKVETNVSVKDAPAKDHEGGFGGQEDLEDRYATTSGEH